jgi:hypothetical protein
MSRSAHLVDPGLRPLLEMLPVVPHDATSLALARAQSYPTLLPAFYIGIVNAGRTANHQISASMM